MFKYIENLSEKEYNNFLLNIDYIHYKQSPSWATFTKSKAIYVGIENDNKLVGVAMILKRNTLLGNYFYIPLGPCCNFKDHNLTKIFLENIVCTAKKNNAFMVKIDPNVKRQSKNINGDIVEGENNEDVTTLLNDLGFKHKGYNYGYDGSESNRFTLILDISKDFESIYKNFSKTRKRRINKSNSLPITTRIADSSEICKILPLEKDLAKDQGFKPHSAKYFMNLMDSFKDNCKFYISEINLEEAISLLTKEIDGIKSSKKLSEKANKVELLNNFNKLYQTFGKVAVTSAAINVNIGNYSWNLYLYTKNEFFFINASDQTHIFAIKDSKERNGKYYDFCGFSGSTNVDDQYYGLYFYKSSFNPEFIERIGEFDYIISKKKYKVFKKLQILYMKTKRKINYKIYKK
ncbi:MAG: lipid II:glycine glycyltransferase FemX [Anaerorhabdus sp.]